MTREKYVGLHPTWPSAGRHILARFTDSTITVYQAYRPEIALHAVEHQRFGGAFSYERMSWIKPNFLWMMYRSDWARKEGQEHVLAVEVSRALFDEWLLAAVPSSHDPALFPNRESWQAAVKSSDVRLQWDPDHDPAGRPVARRAIQLGLRGDALRRYGTEAISIADVTPFVAQQRENAAGNLPELLVPAERVYAPPRAAADRLGLDAA